MALILPLNYLHTSKLIQQNIVCTDNINSNLVKPLRIGIYNIMPEAEGYELSLLSLLGSSSSQILPVFIKASNHAYASSNQEHIQKYYLSFAQAIEHEQLDGLIITGAPVEKIPFNSVTYAAELTDIFTYARKHIISTMGICWGGIAIAEYLGLEKEIYSEKLCGIFPARKTSIDSPIIQCFNDSFNCPQSRYAGIKEKDLIKAAENGVINILANSEEVGSFIFETIDRRFIVNFGHPEYDVNRVLFEYKRDKDKGLLNTPKHFDLQNPVNNWRENAYTFFTQWLRYISEVEK